MLFGFTWFILGYNKYRTAVPSTYHYTIHDPKLQQYHVETVQYIHRYSCLFFVSCPPREATLFARDPHFPPGMPFKLLGYIYTIPTIYIYIYAASTSFGHQHSSAPTTYILFLCGDIYIIGTSRNGNFFYEARVPQGQRPSALNVFAFSFLFCFVFTAVLNKD